MHQTLVVVLVDAVA